MATDTQFSKIKQSVASIRAGLAGVTRDENTEGRSGFHLTDVGPWLSKAASRSWQAVTETRIARYISQSLTRLIIFANLLAFAILVGGWMILSQQNIWLIDAKRAALVTQSRILAAAIATETMRRSGSPFDNAAEYDPDVIIDQAARSITTPAQSLAKLDFEIKPEQVAPVLARLIAGTNARARIYATDGTMVLDSNAFLETGGVAPSNAAEGDPRYVKPKNFWTRFLKWRLASSLPVYQDRNDISGLSYPEVRKSIKNGETYSMLLMSGSGNQVVAISSPVVSAGDVKGVLMLSTQPGEIGEILSGERLRIGLLAIIAGLATIIASILLARTVAGPMRRLSDAAEAVTADMTASQALPTFPGREDEVAQVARSFENMTSAMRRRIEASERFAADVAHELKNPLTAARTTAESLVYARTEEQRDGLVTQIGEELRRLDRLISDVSNIQRLDAELALQETEPVNLAELINGVTMTMSDVMKGRGSDVELVFENRAAGDDVTVRGHPGRIGQVLTNLIDNAVSFAPAGSRVTIELADDGDHCIIVVRDQGPGIDRDSLDRIFRRFYTYRPSGETSRGSNSGLGLSITQEIVQAHGGTIVARNLDEGGACFTITLPKRFKAKPRRRLSSHTRPPRSTARG